VVQSLFTKGFLAAEIALTMARQQKQPTRVQHAQQERTTVSQNAVDNLQQKRGIAKEVSAPHPCSRTHAANLPWRK